MSRNRPFATHLPRTTAVGDVPVCGVSGIIAEPGAEPTCKTCLRRWTTPVRVPPVKPGPYCPRCGLTEGRHWSGCEIENQQGEKP